MTIKLGLSLVDARLFLVLRVFLSSASRFDIGDLDHFFHLRLALGPSRRAPGPAGGFHALGCHADLHVGHLYDAIDLTVPAGGNLLRNALGPRTAYNQDLVTGHGFSHGRISGAALTRWRWSLQPTDAIRFDVRIIAGRAPHVSWICPPSKSFSAGPTPLYGTCVICASIWFKIGAEVARAASAGEPS